VAVDCHFSNERDNPFTKINDGLKQIRLKLHIYDGKDVETFILI